MLFIILVATPFFTVAIIYSIFHYDLNHAKGLRKLKHGAVKNLIKRHRRIAMGHLVLLGFASVIAIVLLGTAAIVVILLWGLVFMGHMYTLWRFSKQMMATMEMSMIVNQRLTSQKMGQARMTINDEGELVPIEDNTTESDE